MKKMIAMLLAAIMVFGLVACASRATEPQEPATPETPAEIETPEAPETPAEDEPVETPDETEDPDDEIVVVPDDENASDELETPEVPLPIEVGDETLAAMLTEMLTDLDAEFLPYYTAYEITAEDAPYVVGYEGLDTGFDAALAYGPMMGSTAFVMTLFRLPDGMDAESYAKDLQENADPVKWICVSADYVDATANGQYVFFLMSSLEACDETIRQELTERFAAIDVDTLGQTPLEVNTEG